MQLPDSNSSPGVGNAAAWLLSFLPEDASNFTVTENPVLEINSDQYYCDIHASLPGGLEGGTYVFTVEGLTDDNYKLIAQGATTSPSVVRLYLYWNDNPSSAGGYLKNLAGLGATAQAKGSDIDKALVAELRIVSVTRKAGARKYEATITARERIFDVLNVRHLPKPVTAQKTIAKTLDELLKSRLLDSSGQPAYTVYPFTEPDDPKSPPKPLEAGKTLLEHVKALAPAIEELTGQHGRGMLLIRDGKLHIGPRQLPLKGTEGKALELSAQTGLLETQVTGSQIIDPYFDMASKPDEHPPQRRQFQLTLKGRPDIRPGDLVSFEPPPEDLVTAGGAFGMAGALVDLAKSLASAAGAPTGAGPTITMYVDSVDHKLGRTSSFVTTLTGVDTTDDKNKGWDKWSEHPQPKTPQQAQTAAAATPEHESARAVARLVQRSVEQLRFPEVGEVRAMQARDSDSLPAQTLTIWQGLKNQPDAADTDPEQARRLEIARPSPVPMTGVPYLTPFAYGNCGLILPRYPGTRVVIAHRNGQANDPIDIGALWRSTESTNQGKPGDWWLCLPANADAGDDQHVEIGDTVVPQPYSDIASNDLIDAKGNRAVEALTFTIRIGKDQLKPAGKRPLLSSGDPVFQVEVTQNSKTSSISIHSDGTISIDSAGDLQLNAPNGKITMKAKNVNVTVSNAMDVSKG